MGVVKLVVNEVVYMIFMWNSFVFIFWFMDVICIMGKIIWNWCIGGGIFCWDFDRVFVYMIFMWVMKVFIMNIVYMIVMVYSGMVVIGVVDVVMIVMFWIIVGYVCVF